MTDKELKELKDTLWHSADVLRASAHLAANKYGQPILGLIFLRYADILYKQHNAGRYVGVVIEDDGLTQEEFKEEMYSLNAEFTALSTEAKTLEELIANNLKGLLGE